MVRWWVRQGGETKGQPLCLMTQPSDTALASEGRGGCNGESFTAASLRASLIRSSNLLRPARVTHSGTNL